MIDNVLSINNLKALMHRNESRGNIPLVQNTEITGNLDFNSFFNPSYDLHVKAEDASFQLLFLDISGVSNLDLKIVGRDTVYVDGEVETMEANVNYEFTTEILVL